MKYVLERVARHPLNRSIVEKWKLTDCYEISDVPYHKNLVTQITRACQRALSPNVHQQIDVADAHSSYYTNVDVTGTRYSIPDARDALKIVAKRFRASDFIEQQESDFADFNCNMSMGTLWLPVISFPRGNECHIEAKFFARDAFNLSTADFSREAPYLVAVSNLRAEHKDDPLCRELEECAVSCKLQVSIGADTSSGDLSLFLTVSDLKLDGWTGKRVRVDYLYRMRSYTLTSLISESSDDALPDDITNARISWIRNVISRVLHHPANSRLCRLYGIKDQTTWEDDPSQGYLDRMREVSSQISKFPSLRKTYSNKFFVKGWTSSRDASELPELTRGVFDRIESLGYERKEFKHIGVTDSCEFYIDVGTLWLPVITLSRGNEINPVFATPGEIDPLMANVIVSHEIRKKFPERSYVGMISQLRPIAKDDPHCKSLEAYRACIKFDVQVNLDDNDAPYVAVESNQYACILQSLDKRMPVDYLYSEMIYTLRSLLAEGPDDDDRITNRYLTAHNAYELSRRATRLRRPPESHEIFSVIKRVLPDDTFTVDEQSTDILCSCNVFVHGVTNLSTGDVSNKIIKGLSSLLGKPLYSDSEGSPVWKGGTISVPVFRTLSRGVIRYDDAANNYGQPKLSDRELALISQSDDPADISGKNTDFFLSDEFRSLATITSLPKKREYDITDFDIVEWNVIMSLTDSAYFVDEDENEIEWDDPLPTRAIGQIQVQLNGYVITSPTGRKKSYK
jgi:hypothetical protein